MDEGAQSKHRIYVVLILDELNNGILEFEVEYLFIQVKFRPGLDIQSISYVMQRYSTTYCSYSIGSQSIPEFGDQ